MSLEIIPFTTELIPEAGLLLAQRHQRDCDALPELPPRFANPREACKAIEAAWKRDGASGFAALNDGKLLGYLIGDRVVDPVWGRSAWVRLAGCALASDQDAELVRDLYSALGASWVAHGCFFHFAVVPTASQDVINVWITLSFGIEQVHALLDLFSLDLSEEALQAGLTIRRAGPEDRQVLADLSDVIWRHQLREPVWGITLPEKVAEIRQSWADLAEDSTATVWLAFYDGEAVSSQVYFPSREFEDELIVPEGSTYLTVAGTREAARGLGIGRALTRQGLAQARLDGYRYCVTNWRSTNLLAARFWPRHGFRPSAYRLVRRIDERIAWAAGVGYGAAG